jgi:hypothetical protein
MTKEKITTNWFKKLEVEVIDEENGGCTIYIHWDNEDPDLEYWTNLGEEGQKSFIIEALTNALDRYVD